MFGVIFDMDGVIVDSNPVHKKSIRVFCERYDTEVSDRFLVDRVFGRKNSDWLPEVFESIKSEDIERLSEEKEELFREMFDPIKYQVPGVKEFIRELGRASVPMAVATSAPASNSSYILGELNIQNYFRAVMHTSDVQRGKPAPDIYEKAASKLKLSPAQCVVFEDSPTGARAAKSAGCITVGVTTTYSDKVLKDCSRVIENFEQVTTEEVRLWLSEGRS